ncbi:DUF1415 domain-containing protein [Conchiformibius kuhniae]|uniref:DUF1415 domain-containing protein n=1 Tax=Conchiformibius kuhniae TaxID=211502 RepID=A0A8T9MYA3_9NEIS|nr:DUF1415 domain-containing protein [Conchiformibius kuhniae]UOP05396.1 DUF1415 domain-containing protein [Conchiformibius kuhniae]
MSRPDDSAVAAHTRLWLEKAVIGLNLCPFAKAPYAKGRVRITVSRATHLDGVLTALDDELHTLLATPAEQVETTLLVLPDAYADFLAFNDMLDAADAALADHGAEGVIQIAPFHPDFYFDGTAPDHITNHTNRSPYPTLHLIRESSIDKAVAAFPDAEAVFGRNIRLLEQMGHAGWQALGLPDTRGGSHG